MGAKRGKTSSNVLYRNRYFCILILAHKSITCRISRVGQGKMILSVYASNAVRKIREKEMQNDKIQQVVQIFLVSSR